MALTALFKKPDWQHRKPERRRAAVTRQREPALLDALPDIAQSDPDTGVRLAAIDRLGDFYLDMRYAYEDPDPVVREHCLARYQAALLGTEESARQRLQEDERDKLIRRLTDRQLLNQLRRHAAAASTRRAALDTLNQPAAFADTAVHDPDAILRRHASEQVDDEASLRDIAERLRKHDKQLHQHLLERLDDLAIARGDQEAVAERATSLCQQMEQLMLHTRQASMQHFDHLEHQWARIEAAVSPEFQARYHRARDVVGIACGRRPAPEPVPATTVEKTNAAADELEGQPTPPPEPEPEPQPDPGLLSLLDNVRQQADRASELREQQLQDWESRQHELVSQLDDQPENGPAIEALERALRSIHRARQKHQEKVQQGDVAARLDELERALEEKQLPPAAQAEKAIVDLASAGGHWPSSLSQRWRQLRQRLGELRSWQRWADNQVRETLCEQAEALLQDRPHPDALMEKLKQLREQWQQLDAKEAATEASGRPSGGALRRRFHQATRAAHDLARPFFEKRDSVRSHHTDQLTQRAEELDALRAQLPDADWKQVEQAIRQGHAALRDLPNALPKARKALAERLRQAIQPLSEALEDHQQRVERIKQGLLDQARTLAEQAGADANKRAGELMQQWKQAGSAGRRREHKLWKPFRAALDAVGELQKAERQSQQQARTAAIEALDRALNDFESTLSAVEENGDDLPGDIKPALEQTWAEHGAAATRAQTQQRTRLMERATAHSKQRAQRLKRTRLKSLIDASETLHALEMKRLAGADPADFDLTALPESLKARVERLTLEPQALQADMAKQASSANDDVLLMEIAAELPSPADQEQARMQLQVERLNQHLSGADHGGDLMQMIEQWHQQASLADSDWEALRPRVANVEDVVLKGQS